MNIAFAAAKDVANRARHGLSLAEAERLVWAWRCCRPETRRDAGELRELGLASLEDRVHCVVLVQQGKAFRIVSLRRANSCEVNEYDQALQEFRLHRPDA